VFVNMIDDIDMPKAKEAVEIFAERLRAARELRGLNQRELGERLAVPPSSIAHFEGGRRKPSFENLHRLAAALNVTTDFLLGRSSEPVALPAADPLVRDLSKLGVEDRELVGAILRVIVARRRTGRSGA